MLIRSLLLVLLLSGCVTPGGAKPQEAMALHDRADASYERGDYAGALIEYQQLARLFPQEASFPLRVGNCLAFEARYDEAVLAYEKALALDPKSSRAWYNLSFVRAQILADTVIRMHDNIDPSDPDAQRMRQLVAEVLEPFGQALALPEPISSSEQLPDLPLSDEIVAPDAPLLDVQVQDEADQPSTAPNELGSKSDSLPPDAEVSP